MTVPDFRNESLLHMTVPDFRNESLLHMTVPDFRNVNNFMWPFLIHKEYKLYMFCLVGSSVCILN
jgi:hypothetical protein